MSFGTLRFGSSFEDAAFLGRPERVSWTRRDYCELLYASSGFQIDYEKGAFVYLAFFIGPDPSVSLEPPVRFSQPRVRGSGGLGDITLSADINRATLEKWLGAPESVDTSAEEIILYWTHRAVTLEFELAAGQLKRWSLFPAKP